MPKRLFIIVFCVLMSALAVLLLMSSSPKRYAVFAGYNPNGTIASYVLTYLKALNEVSDGVVYIADSELKPEEEQKLKGLTIYTQHVRHKEYDWGSYKQGYNWLKRNGYLNKADELIFANDSCYAPLGGSFKPMFDKMDKRKELDFWGDSQNKAFHPHLQSYFTVFRRPVFQTPEFRAFLNNVHHLEYSFQYIHTYEIELTPLLAALGFKWDSYIDYAHFPLKPEIDTTDINSYPLTAIRDFNHLFLKRRTFTTDLLIAEDRTELLRYIAKHFPKSYDDIKIDIAPHFLPVEAKRCAVFAGYNPDGTIPNYVLAYLRGLNEIAPDCVVYIADSKLKPEEERKLKGLTIYTQHTRHGEYDWGSYKQGYNWLKKNGYLNSADELIFANDSAYAPLGGSFLPMFEQMSARQDIDFWGNTQNIRIFSHIQSYFMVFKKNVFSHSAFGIFLNNVTTEPQKINVVYKYEIPFTPYLEKLGFKWQTYIPKVTPATLSPQIEDTDPWIYPVTTVIEHHSPFLKRQSYYRGYAAPKEPYGEVLKYLKQHSPQIYQDIKEYTHAEKT